ncbi:MAG: hypothetical protein NDI61_14575 [Bdellovibrionaceae bacterium]|nr:hypothetical protein [Pseudobdellovibrionaceae bacterium]
MSQKKDDTKVIDLSQRLTHLSQHSTLNTKLKDLKMRIDAEQAKVLVTTSLISVLFLVTLANNALLSAPVATVMDEASMSSVAAGEQVVSSRGPASERNPAAVPTGTSQWEDEMVARMAKLELSASEKVGRRPSSLDRLTFEFLEGKYAVRLENGKIRELEFSDAAQAGDRPKYVNDRRQFLNENRDLLPVQFVKSVRSETSRDGGELIESYDLLNTANVPVAKVRFHLDSAGRMISMKVLRSQVALN